MREGIPDQRTRMVHTCVPSLNPMPVIAADQLSEPSTTRPPSEIAALENLNNR